MERFHYAVVGAGMQGVACAYDLARHGEAREVRLLDADPERARQAAQRIDHLVGRRVAVGSGVDASNPVTMAPTLAGADVVVSAVPYPLHAFVHRAAFTAGASSVDMGNDTDVTLELLAQDPQWAEAGLTLIPDTGLAPGLVNSLAGELLDGCPEARRVRLYCGGLPVNPVPPLNYTLRFSLEGLIGEYQDEAIALRGGEVHRLETLTELESVEFPGLGTLEAFTTSSGTSTAPWTYQGRLDSYEYKTLRYPGHHAVMRTFLEAGFWGTEPISVDGTSVRPRAVFEALMAPYLTRPEDPDLVATLAVVESGPTDSPDVLRGLWLLAHGDEVTGFTAMERLTGTGTAIHAIACARGEVRPGCVAYETALRGATVTSALARRGLVTREHGPLS